jgi:VanZ family protein
MIFIFIGSTDLLSAEHTSRFIGPFLRWFAPDTSDATVASIQLVVRKGAHLTEYAILAALLFRALRQRPAGLMPAGLIAFVIASIYASLDEFHQSFVASRTGTAWDVLIDCTGAAIGLALCSGFKRRQNRQSKIENRE